MAFLAASEYFNLRGKAFKVENNQWVSLRSRRISLHLMPELGPCMIINHKNQNINRFKLQPKIKTKANSLNPYDNYGLVFKAARMHDDNPGKERIYAVKFSRPRDDEEFMDAFKVLSKEWEEIIASKSDDWACHMCTYMNEASHPKCEMCNCPRHRIGWNCKLCTFLNEARNSNCAVCGARRTSVNYELLSPTHRKLQELTDYIIAKNSDPTILFETLGTICARLARKKVGRTIYVNKEKVQNQLLSFDGGMEFLNLLGYRLGDKQLTLECPINEPPYSTLKEAKHVIVKTLENLKKKKSIDSIDSSIVLSDLSDRKSEELSSFDDCSPKGRPVLASKATIHVLENLEDQNKPDDVGKWFEQDEDEVEESETIHNILAKGLNSEIRDVLLLVHRTFCSSERLLRVLEQRWFDKDSDIKVRTEILQFCICWIHLYFEDIKLQPSFAESFKRFVRHAMLSQEADMRKLAAMLMTELQDAYAEEKHIEDNPVRSSAKINKDHTVLDFESMAIAQVLTFLDYEKFKKIEHRELLNQAWKKKDRQTKAPTVLEMIAQFNIMCKWTQVCILSADGLVERQKTLSWFINLTTDLIRIKNYNSSWAVFSALTSTNIYFLKSAWAGLREKDKRTGDLIEHKRLFNASGNYKVLRELLKKIEPPAIPHLGILLKDLVFIDDGFVLLDDNNGHKVNFRKCTKLAKRIKEGFGRFQEKPFEFKQDDIVLSWLNYNRAMVGKIEDAFLQILSGQVKAADDDEKSKRGSGILSKIFT